jgi:hypothetical protein
MYAQQNKKSHKQMNDNAIAMKGTPTTTKERGKQFRHGKQDPPSPSHTKTRTNHAMDTRRRHMQLRCLYGTNDQSPTVLCGSKSEITDPSKTTGTVVHVVSSQQRKRLGLDGVARAAESFN